MSDADREERKRSWGGAPYSLGSLGFCLGFRGWRRKTADRCDIFFSLNFLHFRLSSSLRSSLSWLLVEGRALLLGGVLVGVAVETADLLWLGGGLVLILWGDRKSSSDDSLVVDGDEFFFCCFR